MTTTMCKFWCAIATAVLCALCFTASATSEELASLPATAPAPFTASANANASSADMIVRYNKIPTLSHTYEYRYELIRQILEITRPEYGNYQVDTYEKELSAMRLTQVLGEGKVLNLAWASPGSVIANANAMPIPVDILNGLLGYRVCLINKNAPLDTDKISDAASLRQIKIGQGLWIDVDFYKFNQLDFIAVPSFENLFSMLSAKRIECIALGINEIGSIYQDRKEIFPAIDIDKNLLIYYYFPTYLYVSKNNPELAKRIALGLRKMKKNGTFDKLFLQYHEKNLEHLELHHRKVVCLKSPYSNNSDPCSGPLTFGNKKPDPTTTKK